MVESCNFRGTFALCRHGTVGVMPVLRTILLVILILIVLGSLPLWPYSAGWGYYPSGGGTLLLIILLVLLLR